MLDTSGGTNQESVVLQLTEDLVHEQFGCRGVKTNTGLTGETPAPTTNQPMKDKIHPENYRPVLFIDNSSGTEFIIPSTVQTKETAKAKDKKEYPVFRVEISSATHPFYTGQEKTLDTAGRVDKFMNEHLNTYYQRKDGKQADGKESVQVFHDVKVMKQDLQD